MGGITLHRGGGAKSFCTVKSCCFVVGIVRGGQVIKLPTSPAVVQMGFSIIMSGSLFNESLRVFSIHAGQFLTTMPSWCLVLA